jgi:polysaccharide export outer membrane protein
MNPGAITRARIWIAIFIVVSYHAAAIRAQAPPTEYVLGPADVLHITVFNSPELTSDVRVSETGSISFPLIGQVAVVGLTVSEAQAAIARKLADGHFVVNPQVNILPTTITGSQVTVVGHVNRPGRYPLLTTDTHVSDALAAAGGIDAIGGDSIILIRHQDGKEMRTLLDVTDLFVRGSQQDQRVQAGDTLYLPREARFFVYGEVHNPGAFRLERHMTVMQALAIGGFVNERGSERRLEIYRQADDGSTHTVELQLTDLLQPNDVIFVRTRIF